MNLHANVFIYFFFLLRFPSPLHSGWWTRLASRLCSNARRIAKRKRSPDNSTSTKKRAAWHLSRSPSLVASTCLLVRCESANTTSPTAVCRPYGVGRSRLRKRLRIERYTCVGPRINWRRASISGLSPSGEKACSNALRLSPSCLVFKSTTRQVTWLQSRKRIPSTRKICRRMNFNVIRALSLYSTGAPNGIRFYVPGYRRMSILHGPGRSVSIKRRRIIWTSSQHEKPEPLVSVFTLLWKTGRSDVLSQVQTTTLLRTE